MKPTTNTRNLISFGALVVSCISLGVMKDAGMPNKMLAALVIFTAMANVHTLIIIMDMAGVFNGNGKTTNKDEPGGPGNSMS